MTLYFLDSSALVKRYLPEQGTHWIRSEIAQSTGNRAIIAQITPVEVLSGVSRRKREEHITPQHAHAVRTLFERHLREEYVSVGLTESMISQAGDLLERHPLRAYDAVQLASALEINTRLIAVELPPLVFVSADQQLLNAAAGEGLNVENPNHYP